MPGIDASASESAHCGLGGAPAGAGDGDDPAAASILVHREASQIDSIQIAGSGSRQLRSGSQHELFDPKVQAGARSFRVDGLAVAPRRVDRWRRPRQDR